MERLRFENLNTGEDFDRILINRIREHKGLNTFDDIRFDDMNKYFKGGKFLDLGVGDSPVCPRLLKKYPDSEFYALDFAKDLVDFLKQQYPKIKYACSDVLNTPYKDNYFDYIIAGELLEHISEPKLLIKEVMRILKPNGIFSLSVPLEEGNKGRVDEKYHIWSFVRKDIQDLLESYGKIEIDICVAEKHPKIIGFCFKNGTTKTHKK